MFMSQVYIQVQQQRLFGGGGGQGGSGPQITWKTIVYCSKTMEMFDVILQKQFVRLPLIFG